MYSKCAAACLVLLLLTATGSAQSNRTNTPKPKIAFLKSLAAPGWGHYYVDQSNWNRGKYHLAADVLLLLSYAGLTIHSNNLENNWYAYGRVEAGVPIEGRSRDFQLAVGRFNSLDAYNDFQKRSRNWDKLIEDQPNNRWQWGSDQKRNRYNDLRNDFEQIDQQLPALLGMMVVNRIISGISAYNRAKKKNNSKVVSSLFISPYQYSHGVVANVKIRF